MAQKIRTGDEVILIAGKDKGKRGAIRKIKFLKGRGGCSKTKVLVEGANMIKKHVKPNPNANEPGGVKEVEAFVDISNVKLFDAAVKKGGRVGFRTLDDGRKVRYFKSSGEVVSADEG